MMMEAEENIERHVGFGGPLETAIIGGVSEVLLATFLSTLCICIVFVPVFLLQARRNTCFRRFHYRFAYRWPVWCYPTRLCP